MRVSKDSRIVAFVDALVADGWTIESGRPHHKIVSPTGWRHAIPGTPSDHRSALNWISQVRRRMSQQRDN